MSLGSEPFVTVLLPCYNAGPFIREAIQSITTQTFRNLQILVLDDGSNDESPQIIDQEAKQDERIEVVRTPNRGLIATLNDGIHRAHGEYIVRMDADDVSLPTRISTQIEFMEAHPEIGVSGTGHRRFGDGIISEDVKPQLTSDDELRAQLLFRNCFIHPDTILRKAALIQGDFRYDPDFSHVEDYDLWERMAGTTKLGKIENVLLARRYHAFQVTNRLKNEQISNVRRLHQRQLNRLHLGDDPESIEFLIQNNYDSFAPIDIGVLQLASRIHDRILEANDRHQIYDADALRKTQAIEWLRICSRRANLGPRVYSTFVRNKLSRHSLISQRDRLRLAKASLRPLVRRSKESQVKDN